MYVTECCFNDSNLHKYFVIGIIYLLINHFKAILGSSMLAGLASKHSRVIYTIK